MPFRRHSTEAAAIKLLALTDNRIMQRLWSACWTLYKTSYGYGRWSDWVEDS